MLNIYSFFSDIKILLSNCILWTTISICYYILSYVSAKIIYDGQMGNM